MLIGTIVNTATVILGSLIGMSLGNILPERLRDTVMKGLGMCTMFIGVTGMLGGKNALITIISIAVGAAMGGLLDLDGRLSRFAGKLEKKFQKPGEKTSLAEGFVTASLVFCVGTMTIVGALNDGLSGNHEMLFTKAVLDFCVVYDLCLFPWYRRFIGGGSGLFDSGKHRVSRQLCRAAAPAGQHH